MNRLKKAYNRSFNNKEQIKRSSKCGCFNCLRIFSAERISRWIDEKKGSTAMCPHCYASTIIPNESGVEITNELLVKMRSRWIMNGQSVGIIQFE